MEDRSQDPAAGRWRSLLAANRTRAARSGWSDRAELRSWREQQSGLQLPSAEGEGRHPDALLRPQEEIEQCSCSGTGQAQLRPSTRAAQLESATLADLNKKLAAKEGGPNAKKPPEKKPVCVRRVHQDDIAEVIRK